MNILHIACTNGDMCNGVQVVVPQHVREQGKYATVAFVNISNIKVDGNCVQFEYSDNFSVADLPSPFDKPDIVVFHECYRIQYIKIARELNKIKVPYVIVPHGELSNGAQKKKRVKKLVANILIFDRFIDGAAGVQLLSDKERSDTKFGKNKFVATNGINIPERNKQQFRESALKFVYIGRLDAYHKGLDLMVEGVAGCADLLRANMCTVDIYGPNILGRREHVEGLIAEHCVGDIITIHDPVLEKDKESVLLDGDVFIQTSRFEGMPMGILEAMSYGLPCIVTTGTTLADFVENQGAGWGCATDAQAIADTLQKAIEAAADPANPLSKMSLRGREAAADHFAWAHIAEQTIEKYAELARGN